MKLPALLACAICVPTQASSQTTVRDPSATRIVVGPNVQLSVARGGDTHYEVLVSADRDDPDRLIACAILFPAARQTISNIVYATADGGETWQPVLEPALPPDAVAGDPACVHGPDHAAYYTVSVIPPGPRTNRSLLFYGSRDGGLTWHTPTRLTYTDRQYMSVDATPGPFRGRVYVNGNNRIPEDVSDLVLFYSSDGGASFIGPTRREGFGSFVVPTMGNTALLSDGTLVALFVQQITPSGVNPSPTSGQQLEVVLSTDGGATLSNAIPVSDAVMGAGRKGSNNNVNSMPFIAADETRGRYQDRLYVVWPDRRSGRSQIYFASSADRGMTWSPARVISDDSLDATHGPDQFMPNVTVNRDGVVGVMWYDRRHHPDNLGWDVRFTASLDGGATFLPSVQVSEWGTRFGANDRWPVRATASAQPDSGHAGGSITLDLSLNNFMFLGGDTAGLTADATGVFHPAWVDNRTGVPQIWTARVAIRSRPPSASTSEASRLVDVSNLVTLEVLDVQSDRATNTITVRARITNKSQQTITGPLWVRVVAIESELGEVHIPNADSTTGQGAQWDFGDALDDGALGPGRTSRSLSLVFHLNALQPFRDGDRYRLGLVRLRAVILGRL